MLLMRIRNTCISIFFILFVSHTNAQSFIALSTGISKDINNTRSFYAVPVTLRWEPFRHSAFFIEATKEIGFNRLAHADAYSLNPQLPAHVVLTEQISLRSFSVDMGGAVIVYHDKKNNQVTLNISFGVSDQHFTVTYRNYDKANYKVLNPDVDKVFSGAYTSIAPVYNFHRGKRDLFLMLRLQSPPLVGVGDRYNLSYRQTAPVQLTFGYKLFYKI